MRAEISWSCCGLFSTVLVVNVSRLSRDPVYAVPSSVAPAGRKLDDSSSICLTA